MGFIFEYAGQGLRWLSLSGDMGNTCAIILYSLFCLIPAIVLGGLVVKKKAKLVDGMLILLSGSLFFVMYYFINSALFVNAAGISDTMGKMALSTVFYSILVAYLVIKFVLMYQNVEMDRFYRGFVILLAAMLVMFLAGAVIGIAEFIKSLTENSEDTVFLQLVVSGRHLKTIIPMVLNVVIILNIYRVAKLFKEKGFAQVTVASVEGLTRLCTYSLIIIVLFGMVYNIVQICLFDKLHNVSVINSIPIDNVLLVFTTYIVGKYIALTKKIKDENEMFV